MAKCTWLGCKREQSGVDWMSYGNGSKYWAKLCGGHTGKLVEVLRHWSSAGKMEAWIEAAGGMGKAWERMTE